MTHTPVLQHDGTRFRRRRSITALLGLLISAAVPVMAPVGSAAANPLVSHVVHVSVDGVNAQMLADLMAADPANTDGWQRLVDEGASTFNARTDYSHTITLPNHTSMLTARPVTQPSGLPDTTHHGWTSNSDPSSGQTLHNAGNANLSYIASTFDVAHDNGLSTAMYATKSKFSLYDTSYDSANGAPDVTGPDDGADKIDTYLYDSNADNLHTAMLSGLSVNDWGYTFVHYRNPDSDGHGSDWGSNNYLDALREVNGYLNELLDTIEADPQLDGQTVVIVTSDHGGGAPPDSHGTASSPLNYTIPTFVWGSNVAVGADLYALNAARTDPGTGRPDFNAAAQPIRNGETGTLALDLLGLPPVSGTLMSSPMNVSALTGNAAPIVSTPGAQTALVGDNISLQIVASDGDGDPLTYSATGLPVGLSIGSTDGIISGSVTTADSSVVTVTADDGVDTGQVVFTWQVNDPPPPVGTVEVRVASGADDVEEEVGSGVMYSTSSDLELTDDSSYSGEQTIGLRFNGLAIPAGATITAASVEFETDEADSGVTSLNFRAEAADNASAFTSVAFDLTDRPVTTASVTWANVPAWNSVSEKHQTPNLSSIVQEVVGRSGWSPGNSVVIVVDGSGERTAESADGEAENAPLLHVEYTTGAANNAPVVTNPGAQFSIEGDVVSLAVAASDVDGDELSYSASGLPSGLSIGSVDGVISGTLAAAGSFSVTVTVGDGVETSQVSFVWTVDPAPAGLMIEDGLVNGVTESWQTVSLGNTYVSPVVVATVELDDRSDEPVVTRIRNAGPTSFELRIQGATDAAVTASRTVHFFVVDEGVYTVAEHGIAMEAVRATSTATARRGSWVREARTYGQTYSNPVVLGQVMTFNDPSWSVFWASSISSKSSAPTAGSLAAGKHVGEDPDRTRADETIAYVVIEAGSGTVGGRSFAAGVGNDSVKGVDNSSNGYSYSIGGVASPETAVVSSAAMDSGNGGWPVLVGASPVTANSLTLWIDEDAMKDSERKHGTEQVAYLVLGT